jgi:hypothetical protein
MYGFFELGEDEFTPWTTASNSGGWFLDDGVDTTVYDNRAPPNTPVTGVYAFNKASHAIVGTPGGSYDPLFTVDQAYPYYNRGMTMRVSYNDRYYGSEGVKSPSQLDNSPIFIGWA